MSMCNMNIINPNTRRQEFHEKYGVSLLPRKGISKLKNRGFMTFDVETKDGLKGKELYCWSIAFQTDERNIEVLHGDENLQPALNKIYSSDKRKSMYRVVFVHNLGFDGRFIIDWCRRHNIEKNPITIFSSGLICLIIPSLHVKFVDTMQYLKMSQDVAEKKYNVPEQLRKIDCKKIFEKQYRNWTHEDKLTVKSHNKNDVQALYFIMKTFRQQVFDKGKTDILTTISLASLAMKVMRCDLKEPIKNPFIYKTMKDKKVSYHIEEEEEDFVRESYFGGRTEVFDDKIANNVKIIDKNSTYPSIMKMTQQPGGYGTWINLRGYRNVRKGLIENDELLCANDYYCQTIHDEIVENICNIHKEGFVLCKTINPPLPLPKFPLFPIRLSDKILFTNCTLHNKIFAFPEIRLGLKLGYTFEFSAAFIFDSVNYFEAFITKYYKIRLEEPRYKTTCKWLMNGVSGKFAQKFKSKSVNYHFVDTIEEEHKLCETVKIDEFIIHDISSQSKIGLEVKNDLKIKPFMNVAIASYINSNARCEIYLKICEIDAKNHVLACDTDSVSFVDISHDTESSQELGKWKIECEAKKALYLAPKAYILEDFKTSEESGKLLLKLKGLNRFVIDRLTEESHSINEINDELHKIIKIDEMYEPLRESLRDGNILSSKSKIKHYSFKNNKRNNYNPNFEAWNDDTIKFFLHDERCDVLKIHKLEEYRPIFERKQKSAKLSQVMHYFEDRFVGNWNEEQWEFIENCFDAERSVDENISIVKDEMRKYMLEDSYKEAKLMR